MKNEIYPITAISINDFYKFLMKLISEKLQFVTSNYTNSVNFMLIHAYRSRAIIYTYVDEPINVNNVYRFFVQEPSVNITIGDTNLTKFYIEIEVINPSPVGKESIIEVTDNYRNGDNVDVTIPPINNLIEDEDVITKHIAKITRHG